MSEVKTVSSEKRSVHWDLLGIVLFGVSALVWVAVLSYDPADDVSSIFESKQPLEQTRDIDPSPKLPGSTLPGSSVSGVTIEKASNSAKASVREVAMPNKRGATWYRPVVYPPNESIQNSGGLLGAVLSQALFQATGVGAYLIALLIPLSAIVCFRQQPWASPLGRSIGWSLVLVAVCSLPDRLRIPLGISVPIGNGGYLGALVNTWLDHHLAFIGGLIATLGLLAIGLLLSTEYALVRYLGLATAGGVSLAKGMKLPSFSDWARSANGSGVFGGRRSDLPGSITLKDSSDSNAEGSGPVPSFSDLAKQPFGVPPNQRPDQLAANSEVDGPAIRIGRRASTSFSSEDISGGAKAIGRTDLASSQSKPKSPSGRSSIRHEEDEYQEEDSEYKSNEYESNEVDEDWDASEEDTSEQESSQASQFDEEAPLEEPSDDDQNSDSNPDEEPSNSAASKSAISSSGAAQEVTSNNLRIKNSKMRRKEEEEAERNSLYDSLNDTKLPAGAEEYVLPSVELLAVGDDFSYEEQTEEVKRKARILEQTFLNFGFNIRVVEIETGPVIAQYEIEMEAGLRLSKITGLADDLAIALRVPSVRIVAPIPGKNTVGIEVPNEKRQVVRMREVIEEGAPQVRKMKIPLFLGKDVSGKPLAVDLASLPHLLIAGRTGTGKSVCLNSIICSILMARRPDEVRMLMIDPKMVELSGYGRLPHLMHPVVTDMRKAEAILAWAVDKMEDRYSLLARAGVRHITSYNQLGREELRERLRPETEEEAEMIPDHLPFIVIVADEMADLMMTAGKEVEAHIIRLAQKSRAVGIHLILATQKPTVDVITGLIKSNLPARISFQVASRTDSRVVLDENGADKLLGNGDMLFLWPGTSTLLRGQGTYLSDDEINSVVDHCSTGEQNFVQELVHLKIKDDEEEETKPGGFRRRDDLYESAVDIVVREGRGSCSLLQRALGIGYGRAARLIDFMAEDGIVGEYAGSQAREVIITIDQWEQMRAQPDEGSSSNKKTNKIRRENNWDSPQNGSGPVPGCRVSSKSKDKTTQVSGKPNGFDLPDEELDCTDQESSEYNEEVEESDGLQEDHFEEDNFGHDGDEAYEYDESEEHDEDGPNDEENEEEEEEVEEDLEEDEPIPRKSLKRRSND